MAKRGIDNHLLMALTEAYTARAKLFHNGVKAAEIDLLMAEIDQISEDRYNWDLEELCISHKAFQRVAQAGGKPHQVFVHPKILSDRPHLIAYYRNLVTISKKGISQILFTTDAYEKRKRDKMEYEAALKMAQTLNQIISGVIDGISDYKVDLSRKAILAEIGAELQGAWVNALGQGASRQVEEIFDKYVEDNEMGKRLRRGYFELNNGWSILFGSEPDVSFADKDKTLRIAIEIKGSLDVAGAQTRYGEAKKTFSKVLSENPRCHTVYMASCFTDAVIQQIRADGQVRDWFNLTSIIYDDRERSHFLHKIFHIVNTPTH